MLVSRVTDTTCVHLFPVCATTCSKSWQVRSACTSHTILNGRRVQYFLKVISWMDREKCVCPWSLVKLSFNRVVLITSWMSAVPHSGPQQVRWGCCTEGTVRPLQKSPGNPDCKSLSL